MSQWATLNIQMITLWLFCFSLCLSWSESFQITSILLDVSSVTINYLMTEWNLVSSQQHFLLCCKTQIFFGLNLLESSSIFQFLGIFLFHSIPYQLRIFSFLCCCSTCGLRPTASASTSIVKHTESWNHGWRVESELTFYKLHQRFLYPEILRKTDATYSNHTVDWLPYGVDSGNGKLLTMSLLLLSFRASGLVACLYVYVLLTWSPPMSQSTLDSKPDMIHM